MSEIDCACERIVDPDGQVNLAPGPDCPVHDWKARALAAEAKVEQLRSDNAVGKANLAHYRDNVLPSMAEHVNTQMALAEAAEAKVAAVKAIMAGWPNYRQDDRSDYGRAVSQCRTAIDAALVAKSDRPQE